MPQSADYDYLKFLILILKKQKLSTLRPDIDCQSLPMYHLTLLIGIKARDELSYVKVCLIEVYHRQGFLPYHVLHINICILTFAGASLTYQFRWGGSSHTCSVIVNIELLNLNESPRSSDIQV